MNAQLLLKSSAKLQESLGHPRPAGAVILGSGWGSLGDALPILKEVPYDSIGCMGMPTVEGHAGRLLLTESYGRPWLIFQGRRHWYEGFGWEPVAMPVHIAARCGCSVIILTNAAGGIRPDLQPGDFMVFDDHINAMGVNPLVGAHDAVWGPRFPDQSRVYDPRLRRIFGDAAKDAAMPLAHGVYLAVSGPTYETPSEIAAYRAWGADAVGMSTVPEAMLAYAAGLRVAAISCITNRAAGLAAVPLSHQEVQDVAIHAAPRMNALLRHVLAKLAQELPGQGSP